MEYKTLSKKALKLMRLTCALKLAVLLAIAAAAFILLFNVSVPAAATVLICAAVFCAVWFAVAPPIRFRRYKYLIAPDRVEIVEGLIFISRTIIPIDRIHQIDIESGPLDRLTGLEAVSVITAGSSAKFAFLEPEEAEKIALHLNEVISMKLKEQ